MKPEHDWIESILCSALEIESESERQEYVRRACRDNIVLQSQVEVLIENHLQAGSFMDTKCPVAPYPICAEDQSGSTIGSYKLLKKLGEGGMGVVYLAEQEKPLRRQVALKVIREGMNSAQVVARFEHERQALALMDHSNIARVLDAGVTPAGQPYFAMELVRGIPITKYCDQEALSLRDRLTLFVSVCRAVQHAHQKGIIHRDLKPSNVIVGLYDGHPIVKVIDFGVAKATAKWLMEPTMLTEAGVIIGTIEYMAPEQAEMNNNDIDTRADVYSLGVLLYELLTGSPPFTKNALRKAGWGEMLRIIKEVEPSKPSTKITAVEDLLSVAANRQLEPTRLARSIRGELDWITMKCLEKDRTRRYDSAIGLAMELERYLDDEPVQAHPPSIGYRVAKFARRYRAQVIASLLILLSLVGGIAGTTVGMLDARTQTDLAKKAKSLEKRRADAEANERQRAEAAEAESEAVIEFLRSDLIGQAGSIAQANRRFVPNPDLTIREALDRAATAVGDRFKSNPNLEAAIRETIGNSYMQIGLNGKAIEQLKTAADFRTLHLGDQHKATLETIYNLALAHLQEKQLDEAIRLLEQVAASRIQILGAEDKWTLSAQDSLAVAYRDAGRTNEAVALFALVRDAKFRTLGPVHESTLVTLHNLASMHLDAGKPLEAIESLLQIHAAKAQLLGPQHPNTLPSLQNLAVGYWKAKQLDQSIPRFEQLLNAYKKVFGVEHPNTLAGMANLGVNYRDAGRLTDAIDMLEQASRLGSSQANVSWIRRELLIAYELAEKREKAVGLAKELLADSRKSLSDASPQLASALLLAGSTLVRLQAWADAESPLLECLSINENQESNGNRMANVQALLGESLLGQKKFADSESVLRQCLAIRQREEPTGWRTPNTQLLLGEALLGQEKFFEAEPLLLQGFDGLSKQEAIIPSTCKDRLIVAASQLVKIYEACGKTEEAAHWRSKIAKAQ